MFVPTSYSLGLVMALGALICWGSWSVTLVLASKFMAFQLYYVNFTLSFLVTGFVVGFLGGTFGSGGERYDFTMTYLEEISGAGHSADCYLWGMSGGIGMMGNAIGFPLCVGLGMVTGAVVAYVQDPKSNLAFLVPGVLVALCGISTVGLLSFRKDQEVFRRANSASSDESEVDGTISQDTTASAEESADCAEASKPPRASMLRKLVVCITGGLLLGFSNIGVGKATSDPCLLSPYANQTYFSLGVFICSLVMLPLITACPIEGGTGTNFCPILRTYRSVPLKCHLLSVLGGFILCSGFFFFNLGNKSMNLTISYCIGQSAPLVGILWGTFFFKEFAGTSAGVWGLVPVVCVLFAGAIALIAAAG